MLIVSILLFLSLEAPEFITPSDVSIGMEGFGLSAFLNSKIDTFKVKITGKLPPSATGEEIIIAELSGDVVDEAGILAGMSGSPVFMHLTDYVTFGETGTRKHLGASKPCH